MSNRRRSERFTVTLPVTLKDGKKGESTKTANVSAHGLAVFTATPRPLRQYLELEVTLPNNSVPITITAMVARHAEKLDSGSGGSGSSGLGLDFFLFDARAKTAWSQFLSDLRRKPNESLLPISEPVHLEPAYDDTPTFIIKPRDLGRLWAFYRGEMTKGRVRIETPIIKPIGTRVELLCVHPSSQAEWVLEGSIATTNQNARGGRPVLEIELDDLGAEIKAEFRNFVATGRGMIEEDVSMSVEVPPEVKRLSTQRSPSVKPVDLDDEDMEMPSTVLAEPTALPAEVVLEEQEFRFESVVIDLDNLGEEELRSSIIDAPPPLAEADEEATLDRDPSPIPPVLQTFDDDEHSDPTLTPHSPELLEDRALLEAITSGAAPLPQPLTPLTPLTPELEPRYSNRHLFSAFFEEAAQAEEEKLSLFPAPSVRLENTARLRPTGGKPISSPSPKIDDLTPPKTGIRAFNGELLRARPPELSGPKSPPPPPLPSGDEPFDPLPEPDVRVVRGAPASQDEPMAMDSAPAPVSRRREASEDGRAGFAGPGPAEAAEPEYGEMSPQVRGVEGDDRALNPPVPPGTLFDYQSELVQAAAPAAAPRAASKRPPPLPPSARRRAIKETSTSMSVTIGQSMSTEGTDPELDRDIALARARVVRSPNSVTACYRLGCLLMRRGDRDNFADALATLLRVMELEPNHPGVHHKLAEVFARRGEYLQASEHLQRARRLGYRTDPDLEAVVATGVSRLGY